MNKQFQRMQRMQTSTKTKIDKVERDYNVDIPELEIDLGRVEIVLKKTIHVNNQWAKESF